MTNTIDDLDNIDPAPQMPSSDDHAAPLESVDTATENQPGPSANNEAHLELDDTDPSLLLPSSEDDHGPKLVVTNSITHIPVPGNGQEPRMVGVQEMRQQLQRMGGLTEQQIDQVVEGLVKSAPFRTSAVKRSFRIFSIPPGQTAALQPPAQSHSIKNVKRKLFTTPPPRAVTTPQAPGPAKLITSPPAHKRRKLDISRPAPDLAARLTNLETTMHDLNAMISNFPRRAAQQPTSHPPSANSSSRLLSLPGELRNRIYRFAIIGTRALEIDAARWSTHQPPLLKICKQIRHEALRLFYIENKISTNIHDWNPVVKYHFQQLMFKHNVRPENLHHYFSGGPNWENLMNWLKAVHEGRIGSISDAVGKQRPMERKLVGVMFRVVRKATGVSSWPQVEDLLVAHRELLGMVDARWLA
jgi:hypothetical protein